jgi:glutathione S-transferase
MLKLYVGDRNYSSWSMRPAVLMRQANIPCEELEVLRDSRDARSLQYSVLKDSPRPGSIPALQDGDLWIWDTLAIAEYLAELFPEKNLWPQDRRIRAQARSCCAELHGGFASLRQFSSIPMSSDASMASAGDIVLQTQAGVREEIQRLCKLWSELLQTHGGPMLFGTFTIADAHISPVILRMYNYGVPMPADVQAYAAQVLNLPGVQSWMKDASTGEGVTNVDEQER